MDRADFARAQAAAFNTKALGEIAKVLESHSAGVVEFALEMQRRLDEAEGLLAEIAGGKVLKVSESGHFKTMKLHASVMNRVDAIVAASKRRSQ